MARSFDLYECTRELAEHAYALWSAAATLTPLAKEQPGCVSHRIVRLTRKSAEVCRLAQGLQAMVSDGRSRSRLPVAPHQPRPTDRGAKGGWA